MHVVHELGAAVQARLRHRVEVADDHVGLQADFEQRVGAAVDADEHRPVLADVRAQRGEVAAVVVPAHHDQRVTSRELRVQRWQRQRLEREARFAPHVLQRVVGEPFQLPADRGARVFHRRFDVGLGEHLGGGDELVVAPDLAVDDPQRVAFLHAIEEVGAGGVEQRDPGLARRGWGRRSGSAPRSTPTRSPPRRPRPR